MENQFILRRAKLSDIDALSELCQKTFRETYAEDHGISYPAKDLDFYFSTSTTPESFAKKINDPKQAVWIIEDQTCDELVAYAVAGPCNAVDIPHPDVSSNQDALLNRCYVRRDRQGYGFGRQLMNVVLLWLEEHYPTRPIWLAVLAENFKAQKLYTYYGFQKVGEFNYVVGEHHAPNFIMKRQTNTI